MRITKKMILFMLSLALAGGSLFMFGDTIRLIAQDRVSEFSGILMLNACLLATVLFAYRAKTTDDPEPLSIVKSRHSR